MLCTILVGKQKLATAGFQRRLVATRRSDVRGVREYRHDNTATSFFCEVRLIHSGHDACCHFLLRQDAQHCQETDPDGLAVVATEAADNPCAWKLAAAKLTQVRNATHNIF